MINAWYSWSLAVDEFLNGRKLNDSITIEQVARQYARANGTPEGDLRRAERFLNLEEIEKFLKERDAE
jgi:hypothetical protein